MAVAAMPPPHWMIRCSNRAPSVDAKCWCSRNAEAKAWANFRFGPFIACVAATRSDNFSSSGTSNGSRWCGVS